MTKPTRTNYQIDILGSMNPAIHHPMLYQNFELIDAEEQDYALREGGITVFPLPQGFSEFEIPAFRVVCDPGRWSISTKQLDQFRRIFDTASKIFDQTLPHTPVHECRLKIQFEYRLTKPQLTNVARRTAAFVPEAFGLAKPRLEQLVASEERQDSILRISVNPDEENNVLGVSVAHVFTGPLSQAPPQEADDSERRAKGKGKASRVVLRYWSLGDRVGPHLDEILEEAQAKAVAITSLLQTKG